ncbi:lipoyl(octanoyl) transferase LipB [Taibaiella lutea]|uniref:Octanoyltransferase n=1 Tax=Taibaiella lutea TaxID=2608001 RepID=A0A5M6CDV1_9BACT|nr:lipoyl(octanoyl) transferase LipB [Taibaiella lutea]KAA5533344.1 lipoyl(octanoyl) transferase LipB [Taibaiella lutea]
MNEVAFIDLGNIEYGTAWDLQESYMKKGLDIKSARFHNEPLGEQEIKHYLFVCQHPHVYTLGKSGFMENLLINDERMKDLHVTFYKTNRGGDITYHGPGQMVAYPVLDLEQYFTDLGRYMRSLEEAIILTLKEYGIESGRLKGSTGVWLDADNANARKICAMGVKSSRWMTIHGLALNINTDLQFFNYIVPCGIVDKGVTSMAKELGKVIDEEEVKKIFVEKFAEVFESEILTGQIVAA